MGGAEKWQDRVIETLKDTDWIFLNPRRDDWDSSWEQRMSNSQFREQVEWELQGLHMANKILLYFDPNTKSPISLLELGLHADDGKLIVVCPDGFWRKGNIEIVCHRYGITLYNDLESALEILTPQQNNE